MPNGDSTTLTDPNRQKLDGIVQQMQDNKESDENIQTVVDDFKSKYSDVKKKDPSISGGNTLNQNSPTPFNSQSNESNNYKLTEEDLNPVLKTPTPTPQQLALDNINKQRDNVDKIKQAVADYNAHYAGQYFDNTQKGFATPEVVDVNQVLNDPQKASEFVDKYNQVVTDKSKRLAESIPLEGTTTNQLDDLSKKTANNDFIPALKQHIVAKTIQDDKLNSVPSDQTITKIAQRLDPRGYAQTQELNNSPEFTNNAQIGFNMLFGNESKDKNDLLNTIKGTAEVEYNNGLANLANNKISDGILNNNQQLVDEGKSDLQQVDNDAVYKYPSLVKQQIAQDVSSAIAQESGQKEGSDLVEGNTFEKVFGANIGDYYRVMKDKGYLDNPKTKDAAQDLLNHPELFSDASYLGGTVDALEKPFKDLGLSIADISGLRSQKDIYADKLKDENFPEQTPDLKTNVNYIRGALNTTANLVGMTAIALATEGLATEAGVSSSAATRLGAYTSFGLPSYDQNLKDSYNFIDNDGTRAIYATIGAMLNAEGGKILDLGKISRVPELQKTFTELAEKINDNTITKDVANELLEKAKPMWLDAVAKYGVNVTKGAATMSYFTFANGVNKMAFGDKETGDNLLKQTGTAFVDGLLGMSILGAFGAASDLKKENNTSYKQNIYQMAINPDAAQDIFKIGLKDGTYNQEQYNQKVQILNTAKTANDALTQAEKDNNITLDPNQKAVYVTNRTTEGVIQNQLDNNQSLTEEQKGKYEEQLGKLKQQREDLFKGLKFSATIEPLYNLFNAEKQYNEALAGVKTGDVSEEDFLNKKNTYEALKTQYDAGKLTASNETTTVKQSQPEINDTQIIPTFEQIKLKIPEPELATTEAVVNKVNNAENINVDELKKGEDGLYSALEKHPEAAHLIEPLILKLQNYPDEFKTKTATRTVTETIPTEGAPKTEKIITPALEQSIGSDATIHTTDGTTTIGKLKVKDGNYVIEHDNGELIHIGETQITNRDLKLPSEEKVPEPIQFDETGNVKSVTFETKKGDLVTIHDPEKALDLAIQLRAESIGEVPDNVFKQAYNEVQKEVQVEVPVKDISSQSNNSNEIKNENADFIGSTNGEESSSQKSGSINEGQDAGQKNDEGKGVLNKTNPESKGTGSENEPVSSIIHEVKFNDETKKFDVISNKGTVAGSFDKEQEAKEHSDYLNDNINRTEDSQENENDLPFGKSDTSGVSHTSQQERAFDVNATQPNRGEGVNAEEAVAHGNQLLSKGEDPFKASDEFKKDGKISYDAFSLVSAQQHVFEKATNESQDKFGSTSDEYNKAKDKERDWYNNTVKPMQTEWSKIGMRMQAKVDIDTGSYAGLVRSVEQDTGKPLTLEQQKKAKELSGKVASLTKQVEDLKSKLSDKHDNAVKEDKTKYDKNKKTPEQYAKERKASFEAAREALRKLRTGESGLGVGVPLARELAAIAPHVLKIARSLIEEGVDKLSDLVERLHDEFKKDINGLRKRDIMDIIAGDYNKKVDVTKSPDEEKLSDIRQQARLTKKLQDLQNDLPEDYDKNKKEQSPAIEKLLTQIKKVKQDIADYKTTQEINTRFANKKGSDFSAKDAKDIWDYAKKTYLDKGGNFSDTVNTTATDLGLEPQQVIDAFASPKGAKNITDEMYRTQYERNKAQRQAENWARNQNKNDSPLNKLLDTISSPFRSLATLGHGHALLFTHAGLNMFDPSVSGKFFKLLGKQFQIVYGKPELYEKAIANLRNDPLFTTALRAGLAVDPNTVYDDWQLANNFLKTLKIQGNKGFLVLKMMRMEVFKNYYNQLSDIEKADTQTVKDIATNANHWTGTAGLPVSPLANAFVFAPNLIASKFARLTTDPIRAVSTIAKLATGHDVSIADKAASRIILKKSAKVLATYLGALAANQALLSITNSNQNINFLHPTKPDWMKFKGVGSTVDVSGGVQGVAQFLTQLAILPFESNKDTKADFYGAQSPQDALKNQVFGFGRRMLSPFGSTAVDVISHQDFEGNVLPMYDDKPRTGRENLSWKYYLSQKLPIPVADAFKVVHDEMRDDGVSELNTKLVLGGILKGAIASTGIKVGNEPKLRATPFTPEDYKDPIFKYFSKDWGTELPNTSLSSEEIKNEESGTKLKVSDYPKDVQAKYIQVHKDNLHDVLGDIKDNGVVYVKNFKDATGNAANEVSISIPHKGDYEEVNLDKLSVEEKAQVLRLAQDKATSRTKKQLFNQ